MRNARSVSLCVFILMVVNPLAAETIYVGPDDSIQEAVDAASVGDEIEVAPGTYEEAIDFKGKAIRLYSSGGAGVTTIDGSGHYNVVKCVNGEGSDTILDGFTITGGEATGTTIDRSSITGGGMYNDNSNPMVTNCIFTGNTAEWYGGGMGNWNHSSPMVTNCTFTDNSAWTGGGIYNANYSSPEVTNCIFINNMSTAYGGGMYNELESIPTVTNCTFTGNSAWDGGGIFGESDVINCISWDNTANSPSDPFHEIYLATVTFSNIKGGYLGANNIDSDPMFADVDGRLLPGSPCIDAGTDAAVSSLTDHDGNSRIVGAAVDMGAFEAQPATLIATTALLIIDEVEDGSVDSRIERSLLAKLDVALVAVEKGNVTGAVNQLKSLVKLLEAQAGKTTTEDAAEEIITELNTIIDELSS